VTGDFQPSELCDLNDLTEYKERRMTSAEQLKQDLADRFDTLGGEQGWYMAQFCSAENGAFRFTEGFTFKFVGFDDFNQDCLTTDRIGESLSVDADGDQITFVFHTHNYGGSVRISFEREEQILDLYSERHGWKIYTCKNPRKTSSFTVTIETLSCTNSNSFGDEFWLAQIIFSQRQKWQGISYPVTKWCHVTHGQYGSFLTWASDTVVGATIVRDGAWARSDLDRMGRYIEPGMTVLDVGANIGHHAIAFSKMVGATGRVIAFEPQTLIYRILGANCIINGLDNIVTIQGCVGNEKGTAYLNSISNNERINFGALGVNESASLSSNPAGEACRIDSLDSYLSELSDKIKSCDFIKIDVQSFELYVLNGGINTIKQFLPVMFIEISPFYMSKMYDYRDIYNFLWDLDYKVTHPTDPNLPFNTLKQWDGSEHQEWDLIALPN